MSERGRRISDASRQSLFFLLLFQLWQKLLAEGFVRPGMIFSKKNPGHTSSLLPFGRQKEKTMSSTSPTSAAASSRCVRDALFLPNEALCRLSLLAVAGSGTSTSGSSGKDSRGGPKHSEAALVVRIGELAKRLDAALSLMRVWWNASLENDVRREVERGRNWSGKEWRRREEGRQLPKLFLFSARPAQRRATSKPFLSSLSLPPSPFPRPHPHSTKKNAARWQRRLLPPGIHAAPAPGSRGGPTDGVGGRGGGLAALGAPCPAAGRAPRGRGRGLGLRGGAPLDRRGARGGRTCRCNICYCYCCCRCR